MFNTVLTLICNPKSPALDDGLLQAVSDRLEGWAECDPTRTTLAPQVAEDFAFDLEGADAKAMTALGASLDDLLQGKPIDCIIQPTAHRRKKLLIADMDSTMIEQECLDELAGFAGLKDEIAAITERAMRGELDFEGALLERVGKLTGLSEDALQAAFNEKITLTPGARTLVQTMKNNGAHTALVSGGFTFFTARVAAATGFHEHYANELLIEDSALTGDVARPILGRDAKRKCLMVLSADHRIPMEETLAVGDGANDLAMIEEAGLGVAFHAKPAVAKAADAGVTHGDLTALLYLQGYMRDEFVDG